MVSSPSADVRTRVALMFTLRTKMREAASTVYVAGKILVPELAVSGPLGVSGTGNSLKIP